MTNRRFEVAVVGDGVLSAICAIRLARLLGPEQVLVATGDTGFGGACPELLVPDLVSPETMELVREFVVMEWSRFAVVYGDGPRIQHRAICLIDPVQLLAEFEESCAGMTVLTGLGMMHSIEGYLIADGSIHSCKSQVQIPASRFSGRHEAILDLDGAVSPDCPLLLDLTADPCRQFIPIDSIRTMVNALAGEPVLDPTGNLDIVATFPIHSALTSLMG